MHRRTLAIVVVVLLVLAWVFIERTPRTVTILLIGALIAFGAEPLVTRLKRRMPKPAAIALVFTGLSLLVILGIAVIVPLTVQQIQSLGTNLPTYVVAVQHWLSGTQEWLQHRIPGLHLQPQGSDLGQAGGARFDTLFGTSLSSLNTIMVDAGTTCFVVFSAIVLSLFFLMSDTSIRDSFTEMFPSSKRETAQKLSAEITETLGRYISGQVTVSAITALTIAGLSAIVGFKLPWVLFIVTFIGYSIPMIGMVVAQIIAAVLCAPQGLSTVIWVQAIMFVIARISDNVLVPKIMGQHVGISPVGVMLATFAGGELFGLPGLLLAVPTAALIKILWRYFGEPWYRAQFD